jgi:toxin HigB-1
MPVCDATSLQGPWPRAAARGTRHPTASSFSTEVQIQVLPPINMFAPPLSQDVTDRVGCLHRAGKLAGSLLSHAMGSLCNSLPTPGFESPLDTSNATRYHHSMIESFADAETKRVFDGIVSRKWPFDMQRVARRKLIYLDDAEDLHDLRVPPGNRLEQLRGDRVGQYSIRINDQWRICFVWQDGKAWEVEIVDYHR